VAEEDGEQIYSSHGDQEGDIDKERERERERERDGGRSHRQNIQLNGITQRPMSFDQGPLPKFPSLPITYQTTNLSMNQSTDEVRALMTKSLSKVPSLNTAALGTGLLTRKPLWDI
jgi:hypothetical protein